MDDYIKIETASHIAKVTIQSLYRSIKRGTLQHTMIRGRRYTTKHWVNEFIKCRNDRQRVHFQGKPAFDWLNGEWSVKMVARYLHTTVASVHYMLHMGYIKSYQKGTYHVISRESVDCMLETRGYTRIVRTKKAA